ncbi:hypothetical protein HPP92_017020 [Vanilla planifolia]|uniref:Hexosyltransferase n=1 Tax=Vanilla planifolia TaxID=51239 RepID=A0A835URU3_VANPL|nr:hypothetical protein HPP92_017020 [Vanilla planifolia]
MLPEMAAAAVVTMNSKLPSVRRRAYVTFLAGDVVAALYDVPQSHRRLLESQGCIFREIEPVYPPANQTRFAMPYYVINYSKLRIWEFVDYERMVYLDADIPRGWLGP